MKNGWLTKPLGEVCGFVRGPFGGSLKKSIFVEDGFAVYEQQHAIYDQFDEIRYFIDGAKFNEMRRFELRPNDLIMSCSGTMGKVAIVPASIRRGIINQALLKLTPSNAVSPKFLKYWMESADFQESLKEQSGGAAIQNVASVGILKQIKMPLPSFPEQQRIVDILDEGVKGIAVAKTNAEKNIEKARDLFASYLQTSLVQRGKGWVERRLGDVVTRLTNGYVGPTRNIYRESGVPYLLARHVKNNRLLFDGKTFVSYEFNRKNKKSMLKTGDVLLVQSGHIGHSAVVKEEHEGHNCHAMIVITPVNSVLTGPFLSLLFNSLGMRKRFEDIRSGSTVPHLTCGAVKELAIALPDLATQHHLTNHAHELDVETKRLARIYEQKLATLEDLKKSLFYQAFSGGLTGGSRPAVALSFPAKISGITTTDLHAGILATAYDLHEKNDCVKHFGHVKAEKIAHMVEAHAGVDLGREPIKDAAGPNDYPHQLSVEHRARKAGYFDFKRVKGAGYQVKKLRQFDGLIESTRECLGEKIQSVEELLELMLPMNTRQAEICATVYAAWNNLLLDGQTPTDEEIVLEARENWHPAKLNIPREKFFKAIKWIREKNVVPSGKAKKVAAKSRK